MKDNKTKKYAIESLVADEQFQNYCLGTSEEDSQYWESVILTNWTQKETFAKAYDIVLLLADKQAYKASTTEAKVVMLPTRKVQPKPNRKWIASVAAVLLLVTAGYWSLTMSSDTIYITQSTTTEETKQVMLPDSTRVTLNSNSSITYLAEMSRERKASFEGEVYFEVQTTPEKQNFTVKTPDGNIVVTGTKFNLKNRKGIFEATLLEGAIVYRQQNIEDIALEPNEQLTFRDNTIRVRKTNTEEVTDWIDGRMIYKNIKIGDLIQALTIDYDIDIKTGDPELAEKKVSANMVTADPTVLLQSIGIIYGFEVEDNNGTIILK